MKTRHRIRYIVMMGDSLTDRGTLEKRRLLDFIPMSWLSGLDGKSPFGRFTNGYTWSDAFSSSLVNKLTIKNLERKRRLDASDIADGIIDGDPHIDPIIHRNYTLDDDRGVEYQGREFVRSFAEGGLTAHDYSWVPSKSISRFFSRLILSTLSKKREILLKDDKAHELSPQHKAETLVVEWSGANDLITVNELPSFAEVDRAIADRIKNVEVLIKNGYRHFVLNNLPDLSLTPRYKAKSLAEQELAQKCTLYFNQQLNDACKKLNEKYPYFTIDVFDVNSEFTKIYNHPEDYKIKKEKLTKPFTKEKGFIYKWQKASPAKGYMFWDDVHPTTYVHELLAEKFYEKYQQKYDLFPPKIETEQAQEIDFSAVELCQLFKTEYAKKLAKEKKVSLIGFFCQSKLNINYHNPEAALEQILIHALKEGGHRTREVITDLKWIDKKGNLNLNIPVLKKVKSHLDKDLTSHCLLNETH